MEGPLVKWGTLALIMIVLMTVAVWSLFSARKQCRLRPRRLLAILALLNLILLAVIGYNFLRLLMSFSDTLAILGFVVSILTLFVGYLAKRLLTPKKKVIFLAKSRSLFSTSIFAGFKAVLDAEPDLTLTHVAPDDTDEEREVFQRNWLLKKDIEEAEALVIVPVRDSPELQNRLRELAQAGVFIVLIDCKVANSAFYLHAARMPFFVTANHQKGGELVAQLVRANVLTEDDYALIMVGPPHSGPARMRIQNCLFALCLSGFPGRMVGCELHSWDVQTAVSAAIAALRRVPAPAINTKRKVVIVCANDNICLALNTEVQSAGLSHLDIKLIGYDGVRDQQGHFIVGKAQLCIGTVDTNIHRLGGLAADIILQGVRGNSPSKNQPNDPRLVLPPW